MVDGSGVAVSSLLKLVLVVKPVVWVIVAVSVSEYGATTKPASPLTVFENVPGPNGPWIGSEKEFPNPWLHHSGCVLCLVQSSVEVSWMNSAHDHPV